MRLIDDAYQAAGLPIRELPAAAVKEHAGDEHGIVGHRHMPAAGQRHEACVRQPPHRDTGLAGPQHPVPAPQPMVTGTLAGTVPVKTSRSARIA